MKLKFGFNNYFSQYNLLIILAVLLIIAAIWTPRFYSRVNLTSILRLSAVLGLATLGESLVLLVKGVDLSVGAVMGLASILAAVFMQSISVLASVAFTLLICTVAGLANGLLVVKGKMSPFVATLAMMWILRGVAGLVTQARIIPIREKAFTGLATSALGNLIPLVFVGLVVLGVLLHFVLNWTGPGRHLYAVGGDEQAAYYSGVNISEVRIFVYLVAGLLYGVAGLVFSAYVRCGMPFAAEGYEFRAITAAALGGVALSGGVGSLWRATLGGIILIMLYSLVTVFAISPYVQGLFEGVILIGAVYLCQRWIK